MRRRTDIKDVQPGDLIRDKFDVGNLGKYQLGTAFEVEWVANLNMIKVHIYWHNHDIDGFVYYDQLHIDEGNMIAYYV